MIQVREPVELFVHSEGEREPRVVLIDDERSLGDMLMELGIADEMHVFLGEATDLLDTSVEEDNGESSHKPAERALPARDAGDGGGG